MKEANENMQLDCRSILVFLELSFEFVMTRNKHEFLIVVNSLFFPERQEKSTNLQLSSDSMYFSGTQVLLVKL